MNDVKLYLADELIWENPSSLGHFGVKIRKQVYEERLCKQLDIRNAVRDLVRCGKI